MSLEIVNKYNESLHALYDHVGFKEDWVICPIDDCTEMYWDLFGDPAQEVHFAKTEEDLRRQGGDYYVDDIYTQRFYKKWVYEGKDFTMIFCDPHTDGMKWFRIFDNSKRIHYLNNK